jgi:hypothetical protein
MDLTKIVFEGENWILLAQYRGQEWISMNTVMKYPVSKKVGENLWPPEKR